LEVLVVFIFSRERPFDLSCQKLDLPLNCNYTSLVKALPFFVE